MSLTTNVTNLATRVASENKSLRTLINGNLSDLSALTTTDKSNIVAALNEIKTIADSAAGGGVSINDTVTNTTATWSSSKISSEIAAGIPTWDTLASKPAVIAAGATAADARTVIGAGTSNLTLGTTGATAAAGNHTHTSASVTDFQTAVDARIQLIIDAAPTTLDTLNELAAALGDDPSFATTMSTALANRVRVDAVQSFTAPQQLQGRTNIGAASSVDVGDTTTDFVATFEAGLI